MKRAKKPKKHKGVPAIEVLRASLPDARAVAALEGVLDAAEEHLPESLREHASVMRASLAILLGLGTQGGRSFGVDAGDGLAVLVRPVDAQAVAARAAGDLVAKLVPTVRERAKAEFKKKLGDPKR